MAPTKTIHLQVDNSPTISKLLEIKALMWTLAEKLIVDDSEWNKFIDAYSKQLSIETLDFLRNNRQSISDADETIGKILQDNPDLK